MEKQEVWKCNKCRMQSRKPQLEGYKTNKGICQRCGGEQTLIQIIEVNKIKGLVLPR